MSQRSTNKQAFKSTLQSPTKLKRQVPGKAGSDLDETESKNDQDDLDNGLIKPYRKPERGQESTRSAIRGLN
jgi:hypothetical protein